MPLDPSGRRRVGQEKRCRAPACQPTVMMLLLGIFQQYRVISCPDEERVGNNDVEIRSAAAPGVPDRGEDRRALLDLSVREDQAEALAECSLGFGKIDGGLAFPKPCLEESVERNDLLPCEV